MEQNLFVLVSLVLVSFCRGLDWTAPDFCHQKLCPQYKLVETNQDVQKRLYVATEWITTKVESTRDTDLMAAHSRLKNYCSRQQTAGYTISDDTWPVLITVTDDHDISLSWFVPPGATKPENTDPSVRLESRPEATVYVRAFHSTPSIKNGQENVKLLREALIKAGKTFDPDTYAGAGYDSYFSVTHYNEIWIYAV